MGLTKTHHFSAEQNETASLFKALGHPARVAIIEHLLKVNACICGDLVNELPLSQPTISQHLKELKTAGLIQGEVDGNAICYCLSPKVFQRLNTYFSKLLNKSAKGKGRCC